MAGINAPDENLPPISVAQWLERCFSPAAAANRVWLRLRPQGHLVSVKDFSLDVDFNENDARTDYRHQRMTVHENFIRGKVSSNRGRRGMGIQSVTLILNRMEEKLFSLLAHIQSFTVLR